jgi:hypothetical protein
MWCGGVGGVAGGADRAHRERLPWPRQTWPDEAVPALRKALLAEPTDEARQRLVDLLA